MFLALVQQRQRAIRSSLFGFPSENNAQIFISLHILINFTICVCVAKDF